MWSLKLAPTFRDNVLWECYISWLSKVIYDQWTLNINKKIVLWNLQRNLIYRSVLFQLICWIEGIEHVLKEQLKPANNSKSDFFYDPIFIRKDKCELFSIRTWVYKGRCSKFFNLKKKIPSVTSWINGYVINTSLCTEYVTAYRIRQLCPKESLAVRLLFSSYLLVYLVVK